MLALQDQQARSPTRFGKRSARAGGSITEGGDNGLDRHTGCLWRFSPSKSAGCAGAERSAPVRLVSVISEARLYSARFASVS